MSNVAAFIEDECPSLTIGQPMTEQEMIQERNETILRTGTKPRPWSHSALENFSNCPHSYHEVKVLKNYADDKGEAALWGDRVHLALEAYLKGEKDLEPEMEQFRAYADGIKARPGTLHVEYEMCLNTRLQPCKAFDKGVFVRGYADVIRIYTEQSLKLSKPVIAEAIDHKTGKIKPNSKQMMLMALLTFAHFPEVEIVNTSFEWLKFGKSTKETYFRSSIMDLWNEFLPSLKQFRDAFVTDVWQKRQSGLCHGWCPVTKCEFWKPKRIK
jgi:hypothetical protein